MPNQRDAKKKKRKKEEGKKKKKEKKREKAEKKRCSQESNMWSYKAPQRGPSHIGECWTIFHSSKPLRHFAWEVCGCRWVGRSAHQAALYTNLEGTLSYLQDWLVWR
jgi:hypothetical protein